MTEYQIHVAVADHLRQRGRKGLLFWHTPNSGKRHIAEAMKFRRMGVRSGVPDLTMLHDGNAFALELKGPQGRVTDNQLEFMDDWKRAGGLGDFAYSIDQAIACLECWNLVK